MNTKIDAINRLEIEDYSCAGGECEYVTVADTPENRRILLEAGFVEEELNTPDVKDVSSLGEPVLDVAYLAFTSGAVGFDQISGFLTEEANAE